MRSIRFAAFALFIAAVSVPFAHASGSSARDWLAKMNDAARHLNYEGTFVYQHGNQLEVMRIIHRVEKGLSQERLVSLNGVPREIIRNNDVVQCYLPDENSVIVEHRKVNEKSFPSILPSKLDELNKSYTFKLGGKSRIADRRARLLIVKPRDNYRYGYNLWADERTGLLLKMDLVGTDGKAIEQFMFTDVEIGKKIPSSALLPRTSGEDLVWHREVKTKNDRPTTGSWKVSRLPQGFTLAAKMSRTMPTHQVPMDHMVFSDGLAAVSIFIERMAGSDQKGMQGLSTMGAVNAYGTVRDGYQITVVGEVPASTVSLIGKSIDMQP